MAFTEEEVLVKVQRAIARAARVKAAAQPSDRFVEDLGFDSLKMATLSITLETEIGIPVLLNEWIGASRDPAALTVSSLVAYLTAALAEEI